MRPALEWVHELANVGYGDWFDIVKRIQEDAQKELLDESAARRQHAQECIAKFESAYGPLDDGDEESAPPRPLELPPGFLEALSDEVGGRGRDED